MDYLLSEAERCLKCKKVIDALVETIVLVCAVKVFDGGHVESFKIKAWWYFFYG